ncbi:hypothetical protein B0H13DRAFT_1899019 [Mycena leptocephala]|nr:hypothetical protein B0H13DRAFT_1899019 [Mycena leptocephala]
MYATAINSGKEDQRVVRDARYRNLVQDTHREMDVLSTIFLQSTNEITPEGLLNFDFERDVTAVMYFLSSGMPRKVIDTLAHAGMSLSYDTTKTANRKLAVAQIERACLAARTGHAIGWDNIHVSLSQHVEQRTMAPAKARSIHQHLLISIVELFIAGDPDFDYLKESPELQHPQYRPPPADHITQEHVLQTTTREEGSTAGTTQLSDETYLTQLEYDEHALDNIAVPLTTTRRPTLSSAPPNSFAWHYQLAPGLFHVELNLAWLILKIHRGNGPDLGSLQYFIGLLAKTRLGSAQPDFETMVSLFMQFVKTKPTASKLLEMAERVFRKNVMRDNAIISTSGRSYVGVDKNIEFNINFQKNYFSSKGVHGSWDLLSDLAPNVPIFRRLKTQFGDFLGKCATGN